MKAIIHVDQWDVYFQRVIDTPEGPALIDRSRWVRMGTIERSRRMIGGLSRDCWEATDTHGQRHLALTKDEVVTEMARANFIEPVLIDETIPPLFNIEEAS